MIFHGHKSHKKSLELADYARENGLFFLLLPPHTTHKLQPLDRVVLKTLKSYFNNACQKWMRNHPGRELFRESYLKSGTLKNTISIFQTSGIENNKTTENQVSFETEMTSIALGKLVEKKNVSFEKILKGPKLVNITNKRGEKPEIITSFPYKSKLKKEQGTKTKQTKKKTKPKGKTAKVNLKRKKNIVMKRSKNFKKRKNQLKIKSGFVQFVKVVGRKVTCRTGLPVESVQYGYMKTVQ